jgi:hypothetical protein
VADGVFVEPPGDVDLADDIDLEGDLLADELDLDEGPAIVDLDQVRRFLAGLGATLSFTIGNPAVPDHWRFTPAELDDLAPALVALANRRPELARAIQRSDHLVVAATLARYVGRNVRTGREARKEGDDDGRNGETRAASGFGLAARLGGRPT